MTATLPDAERIRLEAAARGVKPEPPQPVTLLCRHCGQPFKTPRIVAVCPGCARHQPLTLGGEMSGT